MITAKLEEGTSKDRVKIRNSDYRKITEMKWIQS